MKTKLKFNKIIYILYSYFRSLNKKHLNLYFIYDDIFIYFINKLIKNGKKEKILNLLFRTLYHMKLISRGLSPIFILKYAIFNCRPLISLERVTIKKRIIYKPILFKLKKQIQQAILLLLDFCNNLQVTKFNKLYEKLSIAMFNGFFKQGPIFKKIYQMHKFLILRREKQNISFQSLLNNKDVNEILLYVKARKKEGPHIENRYSITYWVQMI